MEMGPCLAYGMFSIEKMANGPISIVYICMYVCMYVCMVPLWVYMRFPVPEHQN